MGIAATFASIGTAVVESISALGATAGGGAAVAGLTAGEAAVAGTAGSLSIASTLPAILGASFAPTVAFAADTVPSWLSVASLGASTLGAITGTAGQIIQGQSAASAAKYNAAIAKQNAAVAKENATMAGQAGEEQAAMVSRKTRATVGAIAANQAASGIDVNTGSAVDVRSSAQQLGELDALTVRSNATREAYGYRVQAAGFDTEANLDKFEASNDLSAGLIGGASTFLGSAGNAGLKYLEYQRTGGLSI